MYVNSSSCFNSRTVSIDQSFVGQSSDSSLLQLHQLYGWVKMPSMTTKAAKLQGLPDQPDRTGMRDRRNQSEMTVNELQRSRGIEPPENLHAEMLEAYGYRQLADLVFSIPQLAKDALSALGNTMTFRIGPPGADAALVDGRKSPICENPSVANFVKKHAPNFEIWLSPSAKTAVDMKGMIFVVGENHVDENVQPQISRAMLWFRNIRTAKVFLEGGEEEDCDVRMSDFGLSTHACNSLELGSPWFNKMRDTMLDYLPPLKRQADFLKLHVPSARVDKQEWNSVDDVAAFVDKYQKGVPASLAAEYNPLAVETYRAQKALLTQEKICKPQREKWMSSKLRSERSLKSPNLAVVGADHFKAILTDLSDLPCVFLIPKSIFKNHPELALQDLSKDEL